MIKYIGSKRKLVPHILRIVNSLSPMPKTALDAFSGTSRVSYALKREGLSVLSNDYATFASCIARGIVQTDSSRLPEVTQVIDELNKVQGVRGYFTKTFCEDSKFFQSHNGRKIDAIREKISRLSLDPELESVALTSLMLAADKVDSTVGVQMAYLKKWSKRSYNDLELKVPDLIPQPQAGKCIASNEDAFEVTKALVPDLVYLDPPYNQHSYLGNYHVWETLVKWDSPEVYGVARKRVDTRTRKSPFNSKVKAERVLVDLIKSVSPLSTIILSYSNEGFASVSALREALVSHGDTYTFSVEHDRYIGYALGKFNQDGKCVGLPTHSKNTEFFLVSLGKGVKLCQSMG